MSALTQIQDGFHRWIDSVAGTVNGMLDRLRSKRWKFWKNRPGPEDEETILAMTPSGSPNAEDRVFASQIGDRLARALGKLSLRQRSVFTLRHYEDLSLGEIAEIMKVDVGTVKAHLFRATEKLRVELLDLYFREW